MDEEQKRLAEELLFSDNKKPSFAKALFFGKYSYSQVFPFPKLIDDKKDVTDLLDKIKKFSDEKLDPDWIDRNATIPDHVIKELASMGLFGLTIPKEYEGLGLSQHVFCRVCEELASRCGSTALFLNVQLSIGLKALLIFGTDKQKLTWLARLARGEAIAAFSLTEANAGSDASAVETKAVYDPERNVYILNGKKQWSTNASIANILTVMARTEVDTPKGKQDKITAFLVTPDMPGFNVTAPSLEKVGMRGTKTANLEFRNMEVPAENILGPKGGGLRVCLTLLDYGRTGFGATCTGAAKECIKNAIQHAKTRHQFNRPLATFSMVKEKIAMMAALTFAMEATTYMTAGLIDASHEDIMLEAAILKVFASESLWYIVYETMQIYGGRSFFTDLPFERMMRDARLNMIGEGANEVLRVFIAAVGIRDVGMHLKDGLEALKSPLSESAAVKLFFKGMLERFSTPDVPVESLLLKEEAKKLGKMVRRFGLMIVKALAYYKEDIIEKQLVLNRIANCAIAIYTVTAVLSKLDSELLKSNHTNDELGNDLEAGKFYCQHAFALMDNAFKGLFKNSDASVESLSDAITGMPPR